MALAIRYASSAGGGAHDGTAEADAWSFAEMLANYTAGMLIHFKGNHTLTGDAAFATAGTIANPVVIAGYTTTPGDGAQGLNADGSINSTNMPLWNFTNATHEMSVAGNYVLFQDIRFTGISAATLITISGVGSGLTNCVATNNNTGANSFAVAVSGSTAFVDRCDINHAGASGGAAAVALAGTSALAIYCRIRSASGPGVLINGATPIVSHNLIYNCGTHGIQTTLTAAGNHLLVMANTIYGCTNNGIEVAAGNTAATRIFGNHITDCGGYGIDGNGATAMIYVSRARTRDNVTAAHLLDAEWTDAVYGEVTTDTGGATTDFEDPAADPPDLRLIRTAPGRDTTARGQNIGACGNDYPAASAGGGGARRVIPIPVPMR